MDPPGPVPAATSEAPAFTLMVAFAPSETMAQGWMVTVAGPLMAMVFGTEWVTPSPAQVSLAPMLLPCVTTVPFAGGQLAAPVTVTVALPERVGSSTLVAVMVLSL